MQSNQTIIEYKSFSIGFYVSTVPWEQQYCMTKSNKWYMDITGDVILQEEEVELAWRGDMYSPTTFPGDTSHW